MLGAILIIDIRYCITTLLKPCLTAVIRDEIILEIFQHYQY